ncbi:MAG: TolB family protein, partial [Steroidobacteraceae bacterium]
MIRSVLRAAPLAAALLPLALLGLSGTSPARAAPLHFRVPPRIRAPFHREIDSLILEGVPMLDSGIATRLARYEDVREATFLDWLPDGSMLIDTRFGDVAEVHRVAAPLGMREQLTYAAEPITVAAATQTPSPTGFAFLEDLGGDGNAQVYYYPLVDRSIGRESLASSSSGTAGGARLLTDGRSRHGDLVWSRDGRQLAFDGNERDPGTFDIYTVEVSAGTRPRLLVAGSKGMWRPLDWSPDGRALLIEQTLSSTARRLYLADATTGALTPVDP